VRAGAVQEHPHFGRRDVHPLADLLVRQPFDTAQPEHLGLLVGQFGQLLPHAVYEFIGAGVPKRALHFAVGFWVAVDFLRATPRAKSLPQPVDSPPRRNSG
jgi:hypothetical protein